MQNITIRYRTQSYSINIYLNKSVLELKKEVSKLTGISHKNFDLQVHKIISLDTKEISYYLNDGAIFTMVNVSIDVIVVLNGKNKSFCVNELKKVNEFVKEIIRSSGHNTELSLFYNGVKLVDAETLLSNGVVQNSTLTSKNGKPIINYIRRLTVTYRDVPHRIDIDERKSVSEFNELVSRETSIKVEHFCLQIGKLFLTDEKKMAYYITFGTDFLMTNVTISVFVVYKDEIQFDVKEDCKINDFKKEIYRRAGISGDITLHHHTGDLLGSSTVLESGIINNDVVIAIMNNYIARGWEDLTFNYRDNYHQVSIHTSKSVYALKNEISKLVNINANQFSLEIYWIPLKDEDKISKYMKYGTTLRMWNVTINITVKIDTKNFDFCVEEEMTVDELIMEIIRRSGRDNVSYLIYEDTTLEGPYTLEESGVEHGGVIIAMISVIGG